MIDTNVPKIIIVIVLSTQVDVYFEVIKRKVVTRMQSRRLGP
jgi:formate hydrogenlyase subunit 4